MRLMNRSGAGGPAAAKPLSLLSRSRVDPRLLEALEVALLYLETAEREVPEGSDLDRLTRFSRALARAAATARVGQATPEPAGWEMYLESTPLGDIQRQKLVLLLERNAWNISRVARLMGVTRRTIYLRLRRYGIPRERVYKGRLRRRSA
jgi:transcriptional regulator of acetoin/glycerol metabolism